MLISVLNGALIYAQTDQSQIPVHDPVAIDVDGIYYLFATGPGIAVWSSTDLKNWERQPPVFPQPPRWATEVNPAFRNHIWAPDIFYKDGLYYLYYSISAFGKNTSAIGLAVNKSLDPKSDLYSWEDRGIVVRSVPGRDLWNAIDPNIIEDDEGNTWMSFGSFWEGIKLAKLTEDLRSTKDGPSDWFTIAKRFRSPNTPDQSAGDAAIEAPFIFKKDNMYYLFVSIDYCCRGANSTYKVVVGRSPNIQGPYLDKDGTPMLEGGGTLVVQGNKHWHGVGHNAVYLFGSNDYMFLHGYDSHDNGKAKLIVRKIEWDNDGWPTVLLD